jgi:hypothetical protein
MTTAPVRSPVAGAFLLAEPSSPGVVNDSWESWPTSVQLANLAPAAPLFFPGLFLLAISAAWPISCIAISGDLAFFRGARV